MVKITRLNEEHLKKRVELLNCKEISNGIYIPYPVCYESTKQWFYALNKSNRYDFSIFSEGYLVGFAGVLEVDIKDGRAELYIFLDPKIHGKGVGKKVINILLSYCKIELGLRKITLFVSSNNQSVVKFYESFGFNVEGVLEKHVWFRGEYRDRYILSLFLENIVEIEPVYEVFE